jgi:excisionase family DNA binding protein
MNELQGYRLPAVSSTTGLSIDTLRREIRRGLLPAHKIGRCVTILETDLVTYLAAHRVRTNCSTPETR